MTGIERVWVSHHQFEVIAGVEAGDLGLHMVGDNLVQLTGDGRLTVLTGPHTAQVPVRLTLGRPGTTGKNAVDGWDAASEATLFCDRGTLSVCGLMGDCPEPFRQLPVQAGLVRVRVHARNRQLDNRPVDPSLPPEEFEVFVWPVSEATGVVTIADDGQGYSWTPRPDRAATWAVQHLLAAANPPATEQRLRLMSGQPEWRYPRVEIRRPTGRAAIPFGPTRDGDDLVIPIGDVELRFRPDPAPPGTFRATVRWVPLPGGSGVVPDPEPSTVEITADGLVHSGVRAQDAVPLGLLWDFVLTWTEHNVQHPWQAVFEAAAARAVRQAAEVRRRREAMELRRWGGRMPSQRIRSLRANVRHLWDLDPDLAEALADANEDEQRAVARWAARRASAIAGLDTVGWVVEALDALDRGDPLPAAFADEGAVFHRLLRDPDVPSTTVRAPDGRPNWSQQALAFPAVLAAARPDALVAAVDAVGATAWAHGDDHQSFLADVRAFLERQSQQT